MMLGSGETQLEVERRNLKERSSELKKEMAEISERKAREKPRDRGLVALIGYTNAGKTALLNRLANTKYESHNRLFETLGTMTRSYYTFSQDLY